MSKHVIDQFDDVIAALLAPNGCEWDKEQTPNSLTEYVIEECFELVDAIRNGTKADVREELGDVMFLLLFISRLHKDDFSLEDVINDGMAKMIRRHPHVFADTEIANREELMKNWEKIKQGEKKEKKGTYDSMPRSLPPLTKAYRIHSKAASKGFTWDTTEEVEQQVEAEWLELLDACSQNDEKAIEQEFGDHLFSLVEFGRRKGLKAAAALDNATNRFLDRFIIMEDLANKKDVKFSELSLDDKDELWEEAKKIQKGN